MHGSSIYWFNKVRGITLLLLLMNCQQFNLVKSYRGIYIYIYFRVVRGTKQLCKCNPFITQDSGKSNVPSFPDCFGLQTFSKRLATNRLRWHWKDCSNVLQVLLQNVSHRIIDADRKEGRTFTFSKAILPKIQPKEIGFKGSIQVRRYYVIQNLKGGGVAGIHLNLLKQTLGDY